MKDSSFKEVTLINGDCVEIMVHVDVESGKASSLYAYANDVRNGEFSSKWQWREGTNPLFLHLVCEDPHKVFNGLKRNGWFMSDNEE